MSLVFQVTIFHEVYQKNSARLRCFPFLSYILSPSTGQVLFGIPYVKFHVNMPWQL